MIPDKPELKKWLDSDNNQNLAVVNIDEECPTISEHNEPANTPEQLLGTPLQVDTEDTFIRPKHDESDQAETVDTPEECHQAETVNTPEECHQAETVNTPEEYHQAETVNTPEEYHQTETLDIPEKCRQNGKLQAMLQKIPFNLFKKRVNCKNKSNLAFSLLVLITILAGMLFCTNIDSIYLILSHISQNKTSIPNDPHANGTVVKAKKEQQTSKQKVYLVTNISNRVFEGEGSDIGEAIKDTISKLPLDTLKKAGAITIFKAANIHSAQKKAEKLSANAVPTDNFQKLMAKSKKEIEETKKFLSLPIIKIKEDDDE